MTIQIRDWIYEFVVFGIKEARACVFAGSFFVLLKLSQRYLARPGAAGLQAAPAGGGGWGARGRRGGVKRPFEFPIRAAGLVDGLVVNAERMRQNLEQARGLYFSEAVMLTMVRKGMARQAAYELVQRNALRAVAGDGKFRDLLAADKDVSARLDAAEIDRAFNLEHHLRHAGAIIDRALAEENT